MNVLVGTVLTEVLNWKEKKSWEALYHFKAFGTLHRPLLLIVSIFKTFFLSRNSADTYGLNFAGFLHDIAEGISRYPLCRQLCEAGGGHC